VGLREEGEVPGRFRRSVAIEHDPEQPESAVAAARTFHAGLPILLVFGLISAVLELRGEHRTAGLVMVVLAVVALLVHHTVVGTSRPERSARVVAVTAVMMTAWAPWAYLSTRRAPRFWADAGSGGDVTRELTEWLVLTGIFLTVTVLAGAMLGRLASSRRSDRAIRVLAVASTVVVVVGACWGVSRLAMSEDWSYVRNLPLVGELEVGQQTTIEGHRLSYQVTPDGASVGGLVCVLRADDGRVVHVAEHVGRAEACNSLKLRTDAARRVLYVERWHESALQLSSLTEVPITPRLMRAEIGPPPAWTLGAVFSAIVAVFCLGVGRAFGRKAGRPGGVDGTHLGEGMVNTADGPVVCAAAARLPRGPVTLYAEPHAGPPEAYRAPARVAYTSAAAGTAQRLRWEASDKATSLYATALAFAVVGVAPLAAFFAPLYFF